MIDEIVGSKFHLELLDGLGGLLHVERAVVRAHARRLESLR